jgi:hypothetical protein
VHTAVSQHVTVNDQKFVSRNHERKQSNGYFTCLVNRFSHRQLFLLLQLGQNVQSGSAYFELTFEQVTIIPLLNLR